MTETETALLIEQQRSTHDLVAATYQLLQDHIKEDKAVSEIVTKHVTYWGMTKWVAMTFVLFVLSLL